MPATRRGSWTAIGSRSRPAKSATCGSKGDSVCAGYWNKHEQTKDTIEGGWLRTGDKYTRDADGYFWYAGRSDDMLKVGGQWVSPVEVENALLQHPDVQECGVVGREDHDTLVKPMAFVVLRAGIEATAARGVELEQFVRTRLARLQAAPVGGVSSRTAQDRDREDPALQASSARLVGRPELNVKHAAAVGSTNAQLAPGSCPRGDAFSDCRSHRARDCRRQRGDTALRALG